MADRNIAISGPDETVGQVISKIDRSQYPFAILCDTEGKCRGLIWLNQIRRQILEGLNRDQMIVEAIIDSGSSITQSEWVDESVRANKIKEISLRGSEFAVILDGDGRWEDVISTGSMNEVNSAEVQERRNYLKNILVIGGAGYLGSVLVQALLAKNYRVRVLDNLLYGEGPLRPFADKDGFSFLRGDLRNIEMVVSALDDIDAVVLLAAVVGDPASQVRPTLAIETNMLASAMVANACQIKQVNRFLYASTCSVYGAGEATCDENSLLRPMSLYARTKAAAEQSILKLSDGQFSPCILRMGTLYGLSPRMRFDLVVNTMTMRAFLEKKVQVFGGNQWRPLLHVKDAARAFVLCLEADIDKVGGKILNVGGDEQNYPISQVGEIICNTVPGARVETLAGSTDRRDYRVSFERIKNAVRFTPVRGVREGVEEIYSSLEAREIKNPLARVYYNHYFDSTEET